MVSVNSPNAAPKSTARLDAEWMNSLAHAVVNIETALGAMPQGVFGSVAARLQQFFPGGGVSPSLFPFASATTWVIPGSVHHLGAAALFVQVYDNSVPPQIIQANAVTISQTTYDVTLTFAVAQAGHVILGAGLPQYTLAFGPTTSVVLAGSVHQLGTADLLVQVFTADASLNIMAPATIAVHPTTLDITVTFASPQAGTLIASATGPRYAAAFTAQTTVVIPGATHQLGSNTLFVQLMDVAGTVIEANAITVDTGTYDVTVTFGVAQSGRVLLVRAAAISGADFVIQDAGIPNLSATRLFSTAGQLHLQAGASNEIVLQSALGQTMVYVAQPPGSLGHVFTYTLYLATDTAVKLATSTWQVVSDARLKDVLGPFTKGLETVLQCEPIRYRHNGLAGTPTTGEEHVGLLADAVQVFAPEMIGSRRAPLHPGEPDTDILTYNGHNMTFMLLNAVKELAGRVAALEAVVALGQGGGA